jgi:hypothetical protein
MPDFETGSTIFLQTWNRAHDLQTRESYEAESGNDDDVELLMVMHRALLRGLDRYVSDPRHWHNARVVEPWISIVARCCGRGADERVAMHSP